MIEQYQTASDLCQAIQTKQVTAVAALEHFISRYETLNPALNAIVVPRFEEARERAQAADAALANGDLWGPLHGLPMTVKETYEVAGWPTTAGAKDLIDHLPKTTAPAVQRLIDAGAVLFGKTNTPLYAMDIQTYNKVYGTTNNPWDLKRTPGGSSGGSAAAVAAGLSFLEIGSDIGGSIRTPAHFCGVYGHKPSWNIIPLEGHIPGPPGTKSEPDLAVAGPLGRSAADLHLAIDILAGPSQRNAIAWQFKLPAPRHKALADYRVAYWFDEEEHPIDSPIRQKYTEVLSTLEKAGVKTVQAIPDTFDKIRLTYHRLLAGALGASIPAKDYDTMQRFRKLYPLIKRSRAVPDLLDDYVKAMVQSHKDWMRTNEARAKLQARCDEFFAEYDILLMPVAPVTAFEHSHKGNVLNRTLTINGRPHPYGDLMTWIGLATAAGLPATSAPIGQTAAGLPTNIQIIGPHLEDHTPIAFAGHLAQLIGGFTPPPGYE